MPTKGHEGHDMGKPEGVPAHPAHQRDDEHPGYEIQDVNVSGIVTFLGGLTAFILVFFFFCFFMGKLINSGLSARDGAPTKNAIDLTQPGIATHNKREDLSSNAELEQRQLKQVTQAFPTPVLETDDGFQNVAEMHAREDLLLNFYSTSNDLPAGTVRIPIERAMQLIVQRGLPQAGGATAAKPGQQPTLMAGEQAPVVTAPLTTGFARTGYEQDQIEARDQKILVEKAEGK